MEGGCFLPLSFFIEDYEAALKFYSEKLGMNIRQRGTNLSILDFGGSCLMPGNNGVASIIFLLLCQS